MSGPVGEPRFPPAARRAWLTRLAGAAALPLVGATGPLWLPPSPDRFPQLPLFAWLIPAPAWCDIAALAGILFGAAGMLFTPAAPPASGGRQPSARWKNALRRAVRCAPALFAAALACAMALNQIRVQVWAYQFLLLAGVLAACPRSGPGDRAAVALARALAVGILFHSALSKLDLAFAEGPGRRLMGGFLGVFGLDADFLDEKLIAAAAFAAPAWELVLAVLLAVPSLRRAGLAGAVVMHLGLVATLWELGQSWGVILWNLFFLAHEFVLFWPERRGDGVPIVSALRTAGPRAWAAVILIAAAVTLPFGTRAGYWDEWPGWAVYAASSPSALYSVGVDPARMPPKVELGVAVATGFHHVILMPHPHERTLEELGVPLNSGPREHVGLAIADAHRIKNVYPSSFAEPRVLLFPGVAPLSRPAAPAFGPGGGRIAAGWGEVEALADAFLLNARPRALSLPPEAR